MAAATFPEDDAADDSIEKLPEYEFFDLLIANDRVGTLVQRLREARCSERKRQALLDLEEIVNKGPGFAREARDEGAVNALTILVKESGEDEEVVHIACRLISACNGTLADHGVRVQEFTYGPVTVAVREASLVDGLGNKVWAIAHSLSRHLVENVELVEGRSVLEIGAGTGLCGLVAAKLGASQVVLTDCIEAVLSNLRECAAVNATCRGGHCNGSHDHEEDQWDWDTLHVRCMNWRDDLDRLNSAEPSCSSALKKDLGETPKLGANDTFDVVLGSDILYEAEHAPMVAAVMKQRLRTSGIGLIALAVRDQKLLNELMKQLDLQDLQVDPRQVKPCEENRGILGPERDYEGGFVILNVAHVH